MARTVYRSADLSIILAAALLIRLALAPWTVHPGDVPELSAWADALAAHGWVDLYAASSANYPPLGTLLVGLSAALFRLAAPGAPFDPGDPRRARWLGIAAALHPALLLMSAAWGQLESVYAALALGALICALEGKALPAGALIAAGALVKPQGAALAPLIALAALSGPHTEAPRRLLYVIMGAVLLSAPLLLPFALTGRLPLLAARLGALRAAPGWWTVNAPNLWYLLSAGRANWAFNAPLIAPDTAPLVTGLSARTLGMLLLGLWSVITLAGAWRARGNPHAWLLAGSLLFLGLFLWPTQAHERYLFGALVLAPGVPALAGNPASLRRGSLWALALGLGGALTLLWAAPALIGLPGPGGWLPGGLALAVLLLISGAAGMAWLWISGQQRRTAG